MFSHLLSVKCFFKYIFFLKKSPSDKNRQKIYFANGNLNRKEDVRDFRFRVV
nr:hypothetical protein MarFTME_075 [Marseillevirus futianmevirus]